MDKPKNQRQLKRRDFLAGGLLLGTATLLAPHLKGMAYASNVPSIKNTFRQDNPMEHRHIGSLEVSAIGLGCLPMVGYYGGHYEKKR